MKTFKDFITEKTTVATLVESETINEKEDEEKVFTKIKDWNVKALKGYARKVGVPDEVVDDRKANEEFLIDEIMGHLFDDDWMHKLMKKGVIQ